MSTIVDFVPFQAMTDSRKSPTPPPVQPKQKSEMEIMIEKHSGKAANEEKISPQKKKPSPAKPKKNPFESEGLPTDPEELAMLGIDPNDLAGFGQ